MPRSNPPAPPSTLTAKALRALFNTELASELDEAFEKVLAAGDSVAPALRTLLENEETHVSAHAAQALALLGHDEGFNRLANELIEYEGVMKWLVGRGDKGVRALFFCKKGGSTGVFALETYVRTVEPHLIAILDEKGCPAYVMGLIMPLLGSRGTERGLEAVVAVLADRARWKDSRTQAASALQHFGQRGHTNVVDALGEHLANPKETPRVRRACAEALLWVGGPSADEWLKKGDRRIVEPERAKLRKEIGRTQWGTSSDGRLRRISELL